MSQAKKEGINIEESEETSGVVSKNFLGTEGEMPSSDKLNELPKAVASDNHIQEKGIKQDVN